MYFLPRAPTRKRALVEIDSRMDAREIRESVGRGIGIIDSPPFTISARNGLLAHGASFSGDGHIASWTVGVSRAWLVDRARWNGASNAEIADCASLLEVPIAPTPSALGISAMRRMYRPNTPLLASTPAREESIIRRWLAGGRVEYYADPRVVYPSLIWEDINGAYPYAAMELPAGGTCLYNGELPRNAAVGFQRATIIASGGVLSGPLPVRVSGKLSYPTEGAISGWYWSGELDDCEELGWDVKRGSGIYWESLTDGLADWSTRLYGERKRHPLLKLVSVAGLGRFGMSRHIGTISADGANTIVDRREGLIPNAGSDSEEMSGDTLLPHVASYIHMRVRRMLYARARACRDLLAADFDAITSVAGSGGAIGKGLGEWKTEAADNARLPAARWVIADGITRQPGKRR